ncbi:CU044_2847 family protein [Nostoc sp. UHCC 0251]|nr:CU044_2847 family protein [Nostoc sp. UHCC 0251]
MKSQLGYLRRNSFRQDYPMTQLTPIQLEDGTIIYIEATNNVDAPPVITEVSPEGEEEALIDKGWDADAAQKQIVQNFQAIEGTIRAYTVYSLNAFKKIPVANIDKVTLEFGIKVGGEAGIPYVTKGTAESNLKVTVECSFPDQPEKKTQQS